MPLQFILDREGTLGWTHEAGEPELTAQEASIIATAEIAQALRSIAYAFGNFGEEFRFKDFVPAGGEPVSRKSRPKPRKRS